MTCRHVATDQPRIIPGRHLDPCAMTEQGMADYCKGCQPCLEPHCRLCGKVHAEGTCPDCLAGVRETLHAIADRCGVLPTEVIHRGINGAAMVLVGPTVDPERLGHTQASYLAGRLPEGWIEADHDKGCPRERNEPCLGCAGGDLHPRSVLLWWQLVWRDALDHDEAPDSDLTAAVAYLDLTMSYMADYAWVPFEDFARDLRRCSHHLDVVVHDQRQGDRANVGCFDCGGDLERRLTERDGFEDFWTCSRCQRRYTSPEYNFALRAKLEEVIAEESA